jgi:hypothetical protein
VRKRRASGGCRLSSILAGLGFASSSRIAILGIGRQSCSSGREVRRRRSRWTMVCLPGSSTGASLVNADSGWRRLSRRRPSWRTAPDRPARAEARHHLAAGAKPTRLHRHLNASSSIGYTGRRRGVPDLQGRRRRYPNDAAARLTVLVLELERFNGNQVRRSTKAASRPAVLLHSHRR